MSHAPTDGRPAATAASARESNPALLIFDCYGKSFGQRTVLHTGSIWGTPGRITVLMGRNGSGKSTLIKLGLGLLRADHGSTRWEGEVVSRPRLPALARRGLFFLPDRGLLSKRLPIRTQLGFYSDDATHSSEVAEEMGLTGRLDLRTGQLSGGEEKRAELAIVRLRAPSCLIADEPFASLAPLDRQRVANELVGHARRGAAVIATGHEVEDLLAIADEVVWMVAGTTHVLGSAAEAASHAQFRREYLGPRGLPSGDSSARLGSA